MALPLAFLRILRPKQWVKNTFVLAPMVFARAFHDWDAVEYAFFAFVLFCVGSSASYVLNDLIDLERDRRHPTKRSRPLAAGEMAPRSAKILLIVLWGLLLGSLAVMPWVAGAIMAYVLLNVAYSVKLKQMPVIDLFAIALGFVIRVYAGALAVDVVVSPWMFVTTLCLALYLAAIKRRQELMIAHDNTREVLQQYTLPLLDRYAEMAGISAVVFYSLFVITERSRLVFTVPLVLLGLYRYWYVVEMHQEGESPTDLLYKDVQLMGIVLLWAASVIYVLWPSA